MKYQNRIMALPMLCMIIIVLSACCFDEQKNETSNVNPKVQSVETVSVTRGNLTPTVSAHTTIIPALDFVLCSSVEGTFEACSSAGNKITEGGNAYDSVLAMLQLGLLVTSFLLLFVSVLGQINIGLSSLEQRTHELLIRRAIGASRANIVTLVLGTQLIISIFVCIASILLSLLIVEGISVLLPPDSPITAPSYPIFSAVIAVITSVIVALLGGLLPAIKAAKLEPALALR